MSKTDHRRAQNREYDARRRSESETRRLYGTQRWKRFSRSFLRQPENVLCAECSAEGLTVVSTVTDHVTPHKGDVAAFWAGPFRGLCERHHNSHKQREERSGYRTEVDHDGWANRTDLNNG